MEMRNPLGMWDIPIKNIRVQIICPKCRFEWTAGVRVSTGGHYLLAEPQICPECTDTIGHFAGGIATI